MFLKYIIFFGFVTDILLISHHSLHSHSLFSPPPPFFVVVAIVMHNTVWCIVVVGVVVWVGAGETAAIGSLLV